MLVNATSLDLLFRSFNTAFNKGFEGAPTYWRNIAMEVPSTSGETQYGWLGQLPKVREWLGTRVVNSLIAHGYTVANKKFELTISVGRTQIEDDQYGIFGPLISEMGRSAAEHPDEMIFNLLSNGFEALCYDGLSFFNAAHPIAPFTDNSVTVSNVQEGSRPAWYLLDTSRPIKPMLWQPREPYVFQPLTRDTDAPVFWNDEFVYGMRGRDNAGFGLWQLAFASMAPLTPDNYEAARQTMMNLKGDSGRPLGIKPDTIVVPPALEGDAMRLLNNGMRFVIPDGGTVPVAVTNEWKDTAKPIVTPWVAE